jgi:hypothetical protein
VIVGGCPRSGTTMLRTMLNSHPGLAMPHETQFVVRAWERRGTFGDLSEPANRRRLGRWVVDRRKARTHRLGIDPEELVAGMEAAPPTLGSVLGTCFVLYAEHNGKVRWGDKRPSYAQHLDAVFALFPDAQFVNVVRDPRATAASVRRIGWYKGDVGGGAALWERAIRAVDKWRPRLAPDQLYEVQYEALVAEPRETLEQLAVFLGLAPDGIDEMLRFYEKSDIPSDAKFHPRVSTPLTTEPVRSWENELAPGEVAFIEHVLAPYMRRYGYEPSAARVPVPEELVRSFKAQRRRKALRRARERLGQAKLRLTYRQPVAARLGDR